MLTERFCQDPLENYFGRQRSMGRRRDNPNLRTFGYQDNTIRTSKVFRPISGNSRKDEQKNFEINSEPFVRVVKCDRTLKSNMSVETISLTSIILFWLATLALKYFSTIKKISKTPTVTFQRPPLFFAFMNLSSSVEDSEELVRAEMSHFQLPCAWNVRSNFFVFLSFLGCTC